MSGHDPTCSHRQRPSRRRLLGTSAGLLATGLAGCVGGTDDDDDDVEPGSTETSSPTQTRTTTATSARHEQIDSFTEVQRTGTQSTSTLSFEVLLEAGQFAHRELRIAQPSEIRITGESTAEMDLFLLAGERAFSKYQAGESAIFSDGFTATGIDSIERVVEVPVGSYFVVFDNTPVYGAAPQGEVNAKFEIVVSSDTATSAETGTETETQTETEPPSQPKIREVRDNFGHTFSFSRDTGGSVHVDDEVVVSDDTVVELCVTEVAKQDDESITYSYDFLDDADHPDNPESATDRIVENCWRWDMRREDYQSDWGYRIWVRNDDEIYYQNNSVESDYSVSVYYTNLTLAE